MMPPVCSGCMWISDARSCKENKTSSCTSSVGEFLVFKSVVSDGGSMDDVSCILSFLREKVL